MALPDYRAAELELTGTGFHFGEARATDELAFRISVRHDDAEACALLLREASGFGLATPPGLVLFSGARPKPQAVVRLFSTLVEKNAVDIAVDGMAFAAPQTVIRAAPKSDPLVPPAPSVPADTTVRLDRLAWVRSGDKGDMSNIGVAARDPAFMPYIWAALSEDAVRARFAHLVEGEVRRWYLPGSHAMNILMDAALGGGGMASLRNDAQGKTFGQVLAGMPVLMAGALLGDVRTGHPG